MVKGFEGEISKIKTKYKSITYTKELTESIDRLLNIHGFWETKLVYTPVNKLKDNIKKCRRTILFTKLGAQTDALVRE